jgi:arabinofuranan 3-O-arabinosyltransferase
VEIHQWEVTHRVVEVGAGPEALLRIPENANDGWVATVDGRPLQRSRVDGWQQAWVLPAGSRTEVRLDFLPDNAYRARLLAGLIAALALLLVALLPVRRKVIGKTEPVGTRYAIPAVLIVLTAVLGGMLPVVLLIGCLLLRSLWRPSSAVLAFGGMAVATVTAVTGRLLGHGQEWAFGPVAQAALLLAAVAVVAASIGWFDRKAPT